ncbi:MAG: histidinol-phosphate transaminase [Pseudonocardiaceae bacterium]|nr:histidinol-phosphate transaminase [Pseudonocardiaceae bacterium]
MTARIRADLETVRGYVPGRTVPGAIKLAGNEVPEGPLPSVVAAIADAGADANRYPDIAATALVGRLATRLDVPAARLSVGCGSVMLCQQLVQVTCTEADEVAFAWRSFESYPLVTQVTGAQQRAVALRDDHVHDLDAMLAAITQSTRLVFVCNPNNPTGTAVRRAELERFLDAVPDGVLVVLDEAYHEFVSDPDIPDGVELARDRDNVAVLRTFSKAYGLAGLRVGYCIAPEAVIEALDKVRPPFSVNAVAQVAALASLDAADEMLARCAGIAVERDLLRDALIDAGYRVPESHANFVWLPLGERTVQFAQHCLEHKVVVRGFAGDGVRVTVGSPEQNASFLTAARSFAG